MILLTVRGLLSQAGSCRGDSNPPCCFTTDMSVTERQG
jgi:hypothetical protein